MEKVSLPDLYAYRDRLTSAWDARMQSRPQGARLNKQETRAMDTLKEVNARIRFLEADERRGDTSALSARINVAHNSSPRSSTVSRYNDYALTYRDGGQHSWLKDLIHAQLNDDPHGEARARLAQHAEQTRRAPEYQEFRDLSRVDGEGGYFSPPAWLLDQFVTYARPGRPFANLIQRRPLPGGTDSLNVPKILTGTATAIQAADLDPVTEVDLTDTFINCPVRTIAGQQGIAVQLIDQSPIAMDEVIFQDLAAAFAVAVDKQCLYGRGTQGEILGVNSTPNIQTIAVDSLDVKGIYAAIANAIQKVLTTRYLPPTAIVMHPRRWSWLAQLLDKNDRPLFVPEAGAPWNAAGVLTDVAPEGIVGQVLGLPVVLDANITTTSGSEYYVDPSQQYYGDEDQIIVLRAQDIVLYESGVRGRVLPETRATTLSVLIQLYGYLAIAVRYPQSICTITGLTEPAF